MFFLYFIVYVQFPSIANVFRFQLICMRSLLLENYGHFLCSNLYFRRYQRYLFWTRKFNKFEGIIGVLRVLIGFKGF
jgi:hypothetical protein